MSLVETGDSMGLITEEEAARPVDTEREIYSRDNCLLLLVHFQMIIFINHLKEKSDILSFYSRKKHLHDNIQLSK